MKLALVTLCLNEMEWLPKLYDQHCEWPDLTQWVFVESADRVYAETNPSLVNSQGLSIDGTSDFLHDLAARDPRVIYIPFGFSGNSKRDLGKVESRQQYMVELEKHRPNFFVVLDADEVYCDDDQTEICEIMDDAPDNIQHFCFQFTHIWHPEILREEPLFSYEITGGFWNMRHTKGIRWSPGLKYTEDHQRPEGGHGDLKKYDSPYCIHMAFASNADLRNAKHRYYEERGEKGPGGRRWYVRSRNEFRRWNPERSRFPRGAKVTPYTGPIPEVFR